MSWEPQQPHAVFQDDLEHAFVSLAIAVVAQAFRDLTIQHGIHDSKKCQADAFEFLMLRLWEPGCLWGELLESYITRHTILEAVKRQVGDPKKFAMVHRKA